MKNKKRTYEKKEKNATIKAYIEKEWSRMEYISHTHICNVTYRPSTLLQDVFNVYDGNAKA